MYCTRCGHRNPNEAKFCAKCGTALEDEVTVSVTPVEPDDEALEEFPLPQEDLEPGQALLLVKRGPNQGSRFLIDEDVTTTGRLPESDMFLDDVTVSRQHAEIHRRGGEYFIKDVGSLNGTYVNRERVEETMLASGDELQIGKFKLVFYTRE